MRWQLRPCSGSSRRARLHSFHGRAGMDASNRGAARCPPPRRRTSARLRPSVTQPAAALPRLSAAHLPAAPPASPRLSSHSACRGQASPNLWWRRGGCAPPVCPRPLASPRLSCPPARVRSLGLATFSVSSLSNVDCYRHFLTARCGWP